MKTILDELNKIKARNFKIIEHKYTNLIWNMDGIQYRNWEKDVLPTLKPPDWSIEYYIEQIKFLEKWLNSPKSKQPPIIQKQPLQKAHIVIPQQCYIGQLNLDSPVPTRKSVDLSKNSLLYKIIMNIRKELTLLPNYSIENQYKGTQLTEQNNYGQRMGPHVELVDNNNNTDKQSNYNLIKDNSVDLCKKSNWYCQGGGFSLLICPGNIFHTTPLHVTVAYFGNTKNCQDILTRAQQIVEKVLNIKLHS